MCVHACLLELHPSPFKRLESLKLKRTSDSFTIPTNVMSSLVGDIPAETVLVDYPKAYFLKNNDVDQHRSFVELDIIGELQILMAIQTFVLSKRWRFPWTSLPCLKFDSYRPQYITPKDFSDFATKVLSHRDNSFTSFTSCGFLSARPPLPSLNYADIHVRRPSSDDLECNLKETRNLIKMFRGLHNARFVRLSSETIEVLNLVPGLQARQTCPFKRLKSLKVHGEDKSFVIPDHVQIYLVMNSLKKPYTWKAVFMQNRGIILITYPHPCSRISQDFNGASLPLSIYAILRFFVIF
ncbi:hypothetical protein H0E87_026367 [Populus deltoides]|uniref:Uncharacterized protein n=1 Tax=Populus deltoides TaxID=3696 RepID=A0A8T2X6H4_POPDE|nr:hypothetical protein H0E87_026367 [Populus deltoides]